jgi:GntR family transcriptional regulator
MVAPVKSLAREPLYVQVCELLSRQIAAGMWKPNAALPNELELAKELGVSAGTVRKAMEKLEADRLVVRRQGRGTFVIDQSAPEIALRFDRVRGCDGEPMAWRSKVLQHGCGAATALEQSMLQLGPGEQVGRKRRLLTASDRPFAVEEASLPLRRLPGVEPATLGDWCIIKLAQQHGLHLARASEEVRLTSASPETAALLGIQPGTALVQLDRIIVGPNASPLEWRSAVCHLQEAYYHAEVN